MRHSILAVLALAATATASSAAAHAQSLREIGRTAAGNPVLVESRTVKRMQAMVDATVRVKFAKRVRAPGGDWWSSRTRLTLDCTTRRVKVLENWYYGDTTWRKVASHNVSGQPAFGTVMGGSMTSVAYDALCTKP
ncbi:MAG TPA: surface-adhesin E family protein [Gemmatimonadaceae bacterium]|nr:surface-adhesin E family protein [Gemmatimonadaceae bacterium]